MALEDALPALAALPFEGVVERVADGVLSGWAVLTGDDTEPCLMEVVGPGGLYLRTTANLYRADLDAAGKRHGLCAFGATLPSEGEAAEAVGVESVAVLVAGLPHRLRRAGGGSTAPLAGWADVSGDPLSQDLVVHRCHFAMTGSGAPSGLLERVRPELPLTAAGVCAALEAVGEGVRSMPGSRTRAEFLRTVQGVYRGVLRREADPQGVEMYCEALRNGMPLSDLVSDLLRRPEFLDVARLQPVAPPGDGGAEEMHRLGDTLEKALLTLAVSAAREKVGAAPGQRVGGVGGGKAGGGKGGGGKGGGGKLGGGTVGASRLGRGA